MEGDPPHAPRGELHGAKLAGIVELRKFLDVPKEGR
jgi:hypothetical protein